MKRRAFTIRRGIAVAAMLCSQLALPAVALDSGVTAGTTVLATGSWAVTPVLTQTSPNSGTALAVNSLSTKKNSYFWVRNVGTFDVQSFTIAQAVSATGRSPSVEIRACTGSWDVTRDTCSGTILVLLSTPDGQSNSAVVAIGLAVGAAIELAAYPTKNGMATAISASVQRSSIRPPRTLHA